jgi:acetyl-CoA carboxylase biotin carboxyl carrier protein
MHAHKVALIAKAAGDGFVLSAPMPGKFRPAVRTGSALALDDVVGSLEVLGSIHELVVPAGAAGYVTNKPLARAVQYGDALVELAPGGVAGVAKAAAIAAQPQTQGLVFRAPTSGRFYSRSTPDKPPFVKPGDELATGATVCLLEVMKTFHRVHYPGERVKVVEVLVKDGDDVNAGDPLLALASE